MAEPETVAQWWEKFKEKVILPGADPARLMDARGAFYAGFAAAVGMMLKAPGSGVSAEDFFKKAQRLATECLVFAQMANIVCGTPLPDE